MKCEIIRDLMPSYIDGLTSEESNLEITEHLKTCQSCAEILDQMKTDVDAENIDRNKEIVKPLRKLNKKVLQSVLITLGICIAAVGIYFYFFEIGWGVHSDDLDIAYSYEDDSIRIEFELTDGNVLNTWIDHHRAIDSPVDINFTECYHSILDDRGEFPNQFSYGIGIDNADGLEFSDDDCIVLHFKDRTKTLYLKEIAEELLQQR